MKVYSSTQLETYQVIGKTLRIHWGAQEVTKEGMDGPETQWEANEALCGVYDDRNTLIEKIMRSAYPTYGSEIAAIRNGGDDATAHENMRIQAKALADGWFSIT